MEQNRPRARQKNVTSGGSGVHKRGDGLGTGPVGSAGGYPGQKGTSAPGGSGRGPNRSGRKSPVTWIVLLLVLLLGGGGGIGLLSGGNSAPADTPAQYQSAPQTPAGGLGSLFGAGGTASAWQSGTSASWQGSANTGKLNTSVAAGARAKRTAILGGGKDTVTIMVYMCGTDLESRNGMATADLQEMTAADLSENVNLLVYTGGCTKWKNNVVSSEVNQIYQVTDGGLRCLVREAGKTSMTNPDTLVSFIRWCSQNYPANRNELIFWDHGGGSVSGYGYDQKYQSSGSMTLAQIDQALKKAGVTFDFIGFDACLMATAENALMLSQYADYLIASEETEPGIGWYYTNWLTELSENTSMETIRVGQRIVDDFVDVCAQKCRGQKATLSVVDLAELETTVPAGLTEFSRSISRMIREKEYKTVSTARNQTREFAQSSRIDQVDLVHLAKNMDNQEGEALSEALLGAVKYNRTSSDITNAYGLSIYFPYQKVSSVDSMVKTYQQIGMDEEYTRCIQEFASLEVSGQVSTGGTASPLPSLLGGLTGGSTGGADAIGQLLSGFLSGNFGRISGLNGDNTGFLSQRALSEEETVEYLCENRLDAGALVWTHDPEEGPKLCLSEEQWSLVQDLALNLFYDDGEGFIDLGLDNVFSFDDEGNLLGETDRTWLAIDGQIVAYYYLDTAEEGDHYAITGRVPAMLNGERVDLILVFDDETPYGYVAGARIQYADGETDTLAKGMSALAPGDRLEFLCDYYSYDGEYLDSYYLGEPLTVGETLTISNVDVGEGNLRVTYRLTDLYQQQYWTPSLS